MIRNLAQRGPDEAPERLPAEQGGGRKRIEMILLLWNYNRGFMGTNIFLLLITVCIVMILITGCMNNSDNSVNVPTTTVSPSVTDQDVTQNAPSMIDYLNNLHSLDCYNNGSFTCMHGKL